MPKNLCHCNRDLCHWKQEAFSENKKRLQKKARSKEFPYSSEKSSTTISKPNYVKGVSLLSRNLKLNYPRNELIPWKCPILWKTQAKLFQICAHWICVTELILSESKISFQQKAKSKEFFYSPERPRTGISKPNCVKVVYLLSRNLKLIYPRRKLFPCKCPILWKTQPKLFQICTNWINNHKTVFKLNYV